MATSSAAGAPEPVRRPAPAFRLSLAVVSVGGAAALLLIATDLLRARTAAESFAVIRAASEIRRDVAVSHLWLEEHVSGDTVDGKEVWGRLDHARSLADGLAAAPGTDPLLRAQAEEVRRLLDGLQSLARRRVAALGPGGTVAFTGIGSPLDDLYDERFRELDAAAAALDQLATDRSAAAAARARMAFLVLWTGWLAVVGVSAWGLYSREQRRRTAEEALRRSEARLVQAQKLEAMGRLAGGLAHDINNYVSAITSQCELVSLQVPAGGPVAHKMGQVIATAGKVTGLIHRLLSFSRQQPVQPEVVDLNEVIAGLRPTLESLAGEDVRLEILPGEDLWRVELDPAQVEQVVTNLLVNAREASPPGGPILLATSNRRLGAGVLREHPGSRPGDYVRLAVTDCGPGIPPEIRDRIFEPFFTTKTGGTRGLGLATVYGITRQNGGHVVLAGTTDRGTTFEVYFPRLSADAAASATVTVKNGDFWSGRPAEATSRKTK